jgi:hypothetical protein
MAGDITFDNLLLSEPKELPAVTQDHWSNGWALKKLRRIAETNPTAVACSRRATVSWEGVPSPGSLKCAHTIAVRAFVKLARFACDDQGIPDFELRDRKYGSGQLYAFDILELDGHDLRREPIEARNKRSPSC